MAIDQEPARRFYRELLAMSGKTTKEIAESVGVVPATLYNWLKDVEPTNLGAGTLSRVASALGVTVEQLFYNAPHEQAGARNLAERDKYQFQFWALSLVNAQPYKAGKKGADGGTDGLIFFQDDKGAAKKIVVSVKGGESVGRTMIADLKNTVEREKAQLGLFVTLAAPTQPMITEAASAGFYESPAHGAFPKIQILTIEGLLAGREQPRYPDLARGGHTFRQAKREGGDGKQAGLFGGDSP